MALDVALFALINGLAGQLAVMDGLVRLLVNDYFVPSTLCLLTVALWFAGATRDERRLNQRTVASVIVAVLLANLLVKLLNLVHFRPRPFSVQQVNLLFYRPSDSSLPSNTAAVGFAFAAMVWQRHRWLGVCMGTLAALFAVARVYCGVHYPLDVLVGGVIGGLSGYVVGRSQKVVKPVASAIIGVARRLYLA